MTSLSTNITKRAFIFLFLFFCYKTSFADGGIRHDRGLLGRRRHIRDAEHGRDTAHHRLHKNRGMKVGDMSDADQVLIFNEFVDEIIREMRKSRHLRELLHPLKLDKELMRFRNGRIFDGQIDGLLNLYRRGNISLSSNYEHLHADLGVADLNIYFHYDYTPFSPLTLHGRFNGSFARIAMTMDVRILEDVQHLMDVKVAELGSFKVIKFTGASPALNWAVAAALQFAVNTNRNRIARKLEAALRPIIEDELRKISLDRIISNLFN